MSERMVKSMSDSNYTDDEKLILFMSGELKGDVLSDFRIKLSESPKLQRLLSDFENLDTKILSSLDGKDQMPEDFRNIIKERINELEVETASSSNLITQIKSLFTLKSLMPAGAGAAFAAVLFSMVGGPALVMKSGVEQNSEYNELNFFSEETNIQEMPWMLQQPALTKLVVNDKTGNYSRYLGNRTNKAEVGESFFIYVTSFTSGELTVKRVLGDGQTDTFIDKAPVWVGSVVEVSDAGYPWKLKNKGRQRIQIFLNDKLTDSIVLEVE